MGRNRVPTPHEGQFCESSETDEKILGYGGGGDVTSHIQFLLESSLFTLIVFQNLISCIHLHVRICKNMISQFYRLSLVCKRFQP